MIQIYFRSTWYSIYKAYPDAWRSWSLREMTRPRVTVLSAVQQGMNENINFQFDAMVLWWENILV